MIPELQEAIKLAQENLYRGFISSKRSSIDWLNTVCGDFHKLFRVLHKYLAFEVYNNVAFMEMAFLCLSQIVICIRSLERTLVTEQDQKCILSATRQCFLDRIIWCLTKLKSLTEEQNPPAQECTTESNFVSFLDLALNLVGPLTVSFEDPEPNHAQQNADATSECARIRSVIEALITQTFAFGNVLEDGDRNRLTNVCQKVLKECFGLEKESALVEGRPNGQNRRLKASVLESAIYQLETQVNDCLLKIVYETFAEMDRKLIGQMRKLVKDGIREEEIDNMTNRIDTMVDRIMQIGLFAISYADNYKAASDIRSCLASIEALDSYLIPSFYVPCDYHSKLLEDHWMEESAVLRGHVQRIIDSNAFALCLIEIVDGGIDRLAEQYDPTIAENIVRKADVFKQHIEINATDLNLNQLESLKIHFEDFKTMTLECRAIVKCFESDSSIGVDRILKRFRILLNKLRKIQLSISAGKVNQPTREEATDAATKDVAQTDEEKEVDQSVKEFFCNTVQKPSTGSILYRSTRGEKSRRDSTVSLLEMKSFSDVTAQLRKRAETTSDGSFSKKSLPDHFSRRKLVKRNSLRVVLFKRQQCKQTAEYFESFKSDIDLQITDILDQLTDLSSTFSRASNAEELDDKALKKNEEKVISTEAMTTPIARKSITKEEIAIHDDNRISINITTDI
ncbi:serendipity locus protein alpha-like [Armigeres subalbatus]|uniref:serendipity locus protein alpha-like n=1 Tax=Armigeres subalbatus TaxID=124917 RepID=UPI002ED2E587